MECILFLPDSSRQVEEYKSSCGDKIVNVQRDPGYLKSSFESGGFKAGYNWVLGKCFFGPVGVSRTSRSTGNATIYMQVTYRISALGHNVEIIEKRGPEVFRNRTFSCGTRELQRDDESCSLAELAGHQTQEGTQGSFRGSFKALEPKVEKPSIDLHVNLGQKQERSTKKMGGSGQASAMPGPTRIHPAHPPDPLDALLKRQTRPWLRREAGNGKLNKAV
ncbi:hypothetical protein B0H16DRAFT_1483185 [Mycena metata]|uniref:Uncharacterized protein n=1 Tax=Mycena metata TaxID=1033252 RepID=A0AAD7DY97_9AGAR|nr:hypothetical protein B0H16DRAFT_1483185 [Mycena metata]